MDVYSKRAISAKAKIIMLHDFRLFTPRHHYIWKRFVNVIFVRRYEDKITKSNSTELYELSTVPYPMPINEIFVSKNLDFWRNGRFRKATKLVGDRTKNLSGEKEIDTENIQGEFECCVIFFLGQPMRVVNLPHTPAVHAQPIDDNQTYYSGLEIEVTTVCTDQSVYHVQILAIFN